MPLEVAPVLFEEEKLRSASIMVRRGGGPAVIDGRDGIVNRSQGLVLSSSSSIEAITCSSVLCATSSTRCNSSDSAAIQCSRISACRRMPWGKEAPQYLSGRHGDVRWHRGKHMHVILFRDADVHVVFGVNHECGPFHLR